MWSIQRKGCKSILGIMSGAAARTGEFKEKWKKNVIIKKFTYAKKGVAQTLEPRTWSY